VVAVLLPALLFPLPPLLDYPNHLARIWLIAGGVDTSPLNQFYFEDWRGVGAGIGIDLSAKVLSPILPPFVIGTMLLMAAMLLPTLGAITLNARVFGGVQPWQALFLAFWCNQTLVAGFLNFNIGLGLALLAVAADAKAGRGGAWMQYGWRIAAGIVLLTIHPFALFFYTALLAAVAFGREVPTKHDIIPRLLRAARTAAIALVPLAVFFFYVKAIPGSEDRAGAHAIFNDFVATIRALVSPFTSYDIIVDFLFAVPIAGLVIWGLVKRKFDAHTGLIALALIFAVAAIFMPNTFGRTGWIDKRFPLLALLTALSATRLNVLPQHRTWLVAAASLLVLARTAWVALNWNAFTPLIDSMRMALADVPAGARVLALQHDNTGRVGVFHILSRTTPNFDETFRHYPAMMIPWRHAFTPMMFAQFREKPIQVQPQYVPISNPTGGVLFSVHSLTNFRLLNPRVQYIRKWRENFDYVLVLNADIPDRWGPFDPPKELQLVNDQGFAELYRVLDHQRM
jgi:hypothetical protein